MTDLRIARRVPCSLLELEAARRQMFDLVARSEAMEREGNALAAFLLLGYATEVAIWLCGDGGVQERLRRWYRPAPRWKIGRPARRHGRRVRSSRKPLKPPLRA